MRLLNELIESNSYYANWLKNYLFIKQIMKADTNLTQTHLYLIKTHEKHVRFILDWQIISNFVILTHKKIENWSVTCSPKLKWEAHFSHVVNKIRNPTDKRAENRMIACDETKYWIIVIRYSAFQQAYNNWKFRISYTNCFYWFRNLVN